VTRKDDSEDSTQSNLQRVAIGKLAIVRYWQCVNEQAIRMGTLAIFADILLLAPGHTGHLLMVLFTLAGQTGGRVVFRAPGTAVGGRGQCPMVRGLLDGQGTA
jgi:hypothetical protein